METPNHTFHYSRVYLSNIVTVNYKGNRVEELLVGDTGAVPW